jgi:hypothetical protein
MSPMRKNAAKWLALIAIVAVVFIGCATFDYGKALFQCDIDHAGNRADTYSCLCDVAKQNGRDCSFLPPDAGAGLDAPEPKDAGQE